MKQATLPWKNNLLQQTQIIKHLTTLFENTPTSCKKQSISGFGTNERVILVRNQHLEYYNMPKKFETREPSSIALLLQQNCKGKVHLKDIYELTYLPQEKQKKKMLSLMIPYNKLSLKNQQAYKSTIKPSTPSSNSKSNHLIQWKFEFAFDLKNQMLKSLQKQVIRNRKKTQTILPQQLQQDLRQSILKINLNRITQQNESIDLSQEENAQKLLDQNIQKLHKLQNYIEFKQQLQQQQRKRQQSVKFSLQILNRAHSKSQQQLEVFPIRYLWRDYHQAYQKVLKSNQMNLTEDLLNKQNQLLYEINRFQSQSKQVIKNYVNQKLVGWKSQKTKFYDFQFYKGLWLKIGGKQINQQFLISNIIADLLLQIKSIKGMKFRVPLLTFTKYKTMKILCMSDMPFSTNKQFSQQLYNIRKPLKQQVDAQFISKAKQCLKYVERIINIKSQNYFFQNFNTEAPLGHHLKIYKYDNAYDTHENTFLENFYYLIGLKDLLPIDYNYQKLDGFNPEYSLRPQLIAEWRDIRENKFIQDNQLLSQGFKQSKISPDDKQNQDKKIVQICDKFITKKALQLISKLQNIEYIIIDSHSLKELMSQMGLNSRYIGLLYRLTQIPYLRQSFMIEMLGRSIKTLYRQTITDMIKQQQFGERVLYSDKDTVELEHRITMHESMLVNCVIDFLNLIFSSFDNNKQSEQFWLIISKRCKQKYDVQCPNRQLIKPGCLLQSVLWHCNINIKFNMQIKLFEINNPFSDKNQTQDIFDVKTQSFSFPSLQTNRIIKKLALIDQHENNTEKIQKVIFPLLKFKLSNSLIRYGHDFRTQLVLSKINILGEEYQKPISNSEYHPSILPYYFSNKSPENFKKALDLINFSLVANHPLFISLYDCYSQYFQNQLLKKSALLAAIKGLGQFHLRTTELYSKYYRQGYKQFQIKATRSQTTDAALIISNQLYNKQKYQSCLYLTLNRIQRRKTVPLKAGIQIQMYIQILRNGIESALKTSNFTIGLQMSEQYSQLVNSFKIKKPFDHNFLLKHSLIICLTLSDKKYYLYKLVLLVIKIQQQYQYKVSEQYKDKDGLYLPRGQQQRNRIYEGIVNQYYWNDTHAKWIQTILVTLKRGYLYFNYLNDLFNNFKYHIDNYGMEDFKVSLGYLDTLVRYFGQRVFHDCLYKVSSH